ncbi:hypothetical protein SeMB42_g00381 [Synchytrium endobioticum]|uniref:Sec1-like protein n=1 Tax=Synchytrium endobioticum TaxID=286115 RepID=A0A507DFZ2_9FUNG|nr:hypothetical protein SeLEV6574_g01279 [Synchytrium endobioticum]TPX54267.1 hypothetical protein SeMB42_g00381 [Synchytrium endobioticum]
MSSIRKSITTIWEDILRIHLPGAALILDTATAQCLKWSLPGGLASVWECGVVCVRDIAEYNDQGLKRKRLLKSPIPSRLVFILSQHLSKYHIELHSWISAYRFIDVKVFTTLSEDAHLQELALSGNDILSIPFGGPVTVSLNPSVSSSVANSATMKWFPQVETVLSEWMNESATRNDPHFTGDMFVSIEHLPLTWTLLADHIVLFPGSTSVFPTAESRVSISASDASAATTSGVPSDVRHLGYSLMSYLDALNVRDEVFAMGETSKQLARFIISRSSTSPRRNSDNGIAVLLFDRTLDLVSPTMHADNILDQIYALLPRVSPDSTDVVFDPQPLLGQSVTVGGETVYASVAHGQDPDTMALISALAMVGQRDGLIAVRKRLVDLIAKEVPNVKVPRILGKVTLSQLQKLLSSFNGNERVFLRHGSLVQVLAAAIESYGQCASVKWDELMSTEKTTLLTLSETGDATNAFRQLVELLRPTASSAKSQPSPFGIKDLLILTVYLYSLIGSTIEVPEDEHILLMSTFMKALVPLDNDGAVTSDIEIWVHAVFEHLRKLCTARSSLSHSPYRNVLKNRAPVPYVSLLKQVMMDVLPGSMNSPDGTSEGRPSVSGAGDGDLQHVPYGGTLGNVFSGFRRLVGAGRPHPSQYKKIVVFIVGGVTFSEVREIRELARDRDVEIVMGSTNVATGSFVLSRWLPSPPPGLSL